MKRNIIHSITDTNKINNHTYIKTVSNLYYFKKDNYDSNIYKTIERFIYNFELLDNTKPEHHYNYIILEKLKNNMKIQIVEKYNIYNKSIFEIYNRRSSLIKLSKTKNILNILNSKKFNFIKKDYINILTNIINEYDENGTNSFFKNGRIKCLEILFNSLVKNISNLNENSSIKDIEKEDKSFSTLSRRLYSYLLNGLCIKIDFKTPVKKINNEKKEVNLSKIIDLDDEKRIIFETIKQITTLINDYNSRIDKYKNLSLHQLKNEFNKKNPKDVKVLIDISNKLEDYKNIEVDENNIEIFFKKIDIEKFNWIYKNDFDYFNVLYVNINSSYTAQRISFLSKKILENIIYSFEYIYEKFELNYKLSLYHLLSDNKNFRTSINKYVKDKYVKDDIEIDVNDILAFDKYINDNLSFIKTYKKIKDIQLNLYNDDYDINIKEKNKHLILNNDIQTISNTNDIILFIDSFNKIKKDLEIYAELNYINEDIVRMILFYMFKDDENFWILRIYYFYKTNLFENYKNLDDLEDLEEINTIKFYEETLKDIIIDENDFKSISNDKNDFKKTLDDKYIDMNKIKSSRKFSKIINKLDTFIPQQILKELKTRLNIDYFDEKYYIDNYIEEEKMYYRLNNLSSKYTKKGLRKDIKKLRKKIKLIPEDYDNEVFEPIVTNVIFKLFNKYKSKTNKINQKIIDKEFKKVLQNKIDLKKEISESIENWGLKYDRSAPLYNRYEQLEELEYYTIYDEIGQIELNIIDLKEEIRKYYLLDDNEKKLWKKRAEDKINSKYSTTDDKVRYIEDIELELQELHELHKKESLKIKDKYEVLAEMLDIDIAIYNKELQELQDKEELRVRELSEKLIDREIHNYYMDDKYYDKDGNILKDKMKNEMSDKDYINYCRLTISDEYYDDNNMIKKEYKNIKIDSIDLTIQNVLESKGK